MLLWPIPLIIVPQEHAYVVERLGKYRGTLEAGINFFSPFLDTLREKVNLKEQVADFPPQPVITKDNVTMQIDTVVYYRVVNPKLFAYGVEDPMLAIENLTATTLRNIVGDMELDETLTSRDTVNGKLLEIIDEATDPWGIKVNRVELKNILPPKDIQESMEKQMRAERERRETILQAEGEKQAAILKAQGEKESAVLRAEAQKIGLVKEAEGHAESIKLHQQAEAESIKMLLNAGLSTEQIVQLKSYEAFMKVADGNATKLVIPTDITNISSVNNVSKASMTEIRMDKAFDFTDKDCSEN